MLLNEIFGFGKKPQPQSAPQVAPAAATKEKDPLESEWDSMRTTLVKTIKAMDPNDSLGKAMRKVIGDLDSAFEFYGAGNVQGFNNMSKQAAQAYIQKALPSHTGKNTYAGGTHQHQSYRSPAVKGLHKSFLPFLQKLQKAVVR